MDQNEALGEHIKGQALHVQSWKRNFRDDIWQLEAQTLSLSVRCTSLQTLFPKSQSVFRVLYSTLDQCPEVCFLDSLLPHNALLVVM